MIRKSNFRLRKQRARSANSQTHPYIIGHLTEGVGAEKATQRSTGKRKPIHSFQQRVSSLVLSCYHSLIDRTFFFGISQALLYEVVTV